MRKPRGGVKEHRRVSCSSRLLLPAPLSLSFFAERFLETPSTGVTASSTKKRASRTQRAQRCCRGLARCDPPAAPSGRPIGGWTVAAAVPITGHVATLPSGRSEPEYELQRGAL